METMQFPQMDRELRFEPSTFNAESRTVEVVWSTGARVVRRPFFGEPFVEELGMDDDNVRLDRLNAGAPVLDSHNSFRLGSVLGVVEDARLCGDKKKKREGRATIRFSQREDVVPVMNDVRDGIIRNISVGYRIHAIERTEAKDGQMTTVRVTDWEPLEVSFVSVPADAGAQVRQDDQRTYPAEVVTRAQEETEMDDRPDEAAARAVEAETTSSVVMDPEAVREIGRVNLSLPADPPVDVEAVQRAERDRIAFIQERCRINGIDAEDQTQWIKDGLSEQEVQRKVLDILEKRSAEQRISTGRVDLVRDEVDTAREAATTMILYRIDSARYPVQDMSLIRPFMGRRLLEIGCSYAAMCGTRVEGTSLEMATQLMSVNYAPGSSMVRAGSMGHSTSDFVNILADVQNKVLRDQYDFLTPTFQAFCRRVTIPDFKPRYVNKLSEAPRLLLVPEDAEFKRGIMTDEREVYALSTYGRRIAFTRQTLINDDMDALGRPVQAFAVQARNNESDLVYAVILANDPLQDGDDLFSVAHGNVNTAAGGAPDVTTVGEAREKMRLQTGTDRRTPINVQPMMIIAPPSLETQTQQFLSSTLQPATTGEVVPREMVSSLELIIESRLQTGITLTDDTVLAGSNVQWYMSTMPSLVDTIEYAYLEGQEGLFSESRMGFEVDGIEFKVRHDFAAKAIDYRGLYRNAGA